jgi:putative transposase
MKNPSPKLARWILQLEEYEFTVEYKEGPKNANADAMSRLPEQDADGTISALDIILLESQLTEDDIRTAQEQDNVVADIKTALKTNVWPTEIQNAEFKVLAKYKDELFIDQEILYRQLSNEQEDIRIILPPAMHEKVLGMLHESPTGGHLGVARTVTKLAETCYWPFMQKIVGKFIAQCLTCEKFKTPRQNTQAKLQPISTNRPWQLIEIDFVGPLPETVNNMKYILSVIDHFSKYAIAYPTEK